MSSNEQSYRWEKIALSETEFQLGSNQIGLVDVNGKKICIGRFQDQWVAFAYKCPHAGGLMEHGFFDATGKVVCPLHRYKFDPVSGRNTSGEGYYLKTYPVRVLPDGVFVGWKKSFWDF
jgi:nitrite reductase/ring-hydroxylating ferredoxin subunit